MHGALRAHHSFALHFTNFAGSDAEALDLIIELEQAKREMGGGEGKVRRSWPLGGWEGGIGLVGVGEIAVVRIGDLETALSWSWGFQRSVVAPWSNENVEGMDTIPR